jgi:hypothetical protein
MPPAIAIYSRHLSLYALHLRRLEGRILNIPLFIHLSHEPGTDTWYSALVSVISGFSPKECADVKCQLFAECGPLSRGSFLLSLYS